MNSPHPNPLPKGEGISDAVPEDADGIAYVHVTAWLETYRGLMSEEFLDRLSIEQRSSQWRTRLSDENDIYHRVVVAENNKQIVGFAGYGAEQTSDPDFTGELFAIYVLKKFQGAGIGTALVKHSAQRLLAMGRTSMLVWVLAKNPYQRFYESLGGVFLRERMIDFSGEALHEKAYGWRDLHALAG